MEPVQNFEPIEENEQEDAEDKDGTKRVHNVQTSNQKKTSRPGTFLNYNFPHEAKKNSKGTKAASIKSPRLSKGSNK